MGSALFLRCSAAGVPGSCELAGSLTTFTTLPGSRGGGRGSAGLSAGERTASLSRTCKTLLLSSGCGARTTSCAHEAGAHAAGAHVHACTCARVHACAHMMHVHLRVRVHARALLASDPCLLLIHGCMDHVVCASMHHFPAAFVVWFQAINRRSASGCATSKSQGRPSSRVEWLCWIPTATACSRSSSVGCGRPAILPGTRAGPHGAPA